MAWLFALGGLVVGALRFGLLSGGWALPSLLRGVAIFDCYVQPAWWWHSIKVGKQLKQVQSELQQRALEVDAARQQVPAAAALSFGLGVATATSLGRLPMLRSRAPLAEKTSVPRVAATVPLVAIQQPVTSRMWMSACLGGFVSSLFTLSCAYAAWRVRARRVRAIKSAAAKQAAGTPKASRTPSVARISSVSTAEPEDEPASFETPASKPFIRRLETPPGKVKHWRRMDLENLVSKATTGNKATSAFSNQLVTPGLASPLTQEVLMASCRPEFASPLQKQLSVESTWSARDATLQYLSVESTGSANSAPLQKQLSMESTGSARTSPLQKQLSMESSRSAPSDECKLPVNVEAVNPHTIAGRKAAMWSANLRLKFVQNLLLNNAVEREGESPDADAKCSGEALAKL